MGSIGKFSFNSNEFSGNIRRLLKAHPGAVKAGMTDVARMLEDETRKRTPVDEGTLTADVQRSVQDYKSSSAAVISIPVNAASSSYAIKMHEGTYQPGKKSQKKAAKVGVGVGRKFITRAIDDNAQRIKDALLHRLRKLINGGS